VTVMLCVTGRVPGFGRRARPRWLARQPFLYQGRCCLLRICGRKTLPRRGQRRGPERADGAGPGRRHGNGAGL